MANISDLYTHFNELILQNTDSILSEMINYGVSNNQSVTVEDVLKLTVTLTEEDYDENDEGYWFYIGERPFVIAESSCTVDWGDGTTPTEYDYLGDGISHLYSQSGTHTITITVGTVTSLYQGLNDDTINTIIIQSSVSSLNECFGSGLTEITFMGSVPPTVSHAFDDASNLTTIHVPSGSLSAYQNAEGYPKSGVTYVEY